MFTDDKMNAEIMNDYFVNIAKELNIPEIMTEKLHGNTPPPPPLELLKTVALINMVYN